MTEIIKWTLVQGEDFYREISWEDEEGTAVPLAGYTAKIQFKRSATYNDVLIEASTDNGAIVVDNNILLLTIPAAAINELVFNNAEADLFVTSPDGIVQKLFRVRATLEKRVTT